MYVPIFEIKLGRVNCWETLQSFVKGLILPEMHCKGLVTLECSGNTGYLKVHEIYERCELALSNKIFSNKTILKIKYNNMFTNFRFKKKKLIF